MKISFITTIFNEEKTIKELLDSLLLQTIIPTEVIIVDGGSSDATLEIVKSYKLKFNRKKIDFVLIIKKGNRSVGRNEAIKKATGDIITCSDSGNILDKNWIKNIITPFNDKSVDVVAGYYKAKTNNIFQKCLVPYVFVMPDKVDPNNFLPATRSIAFKKLIWKKVGGFNENFSHNEDYVFANRLKDFDAKIVLVKDAIVYWLPRTTFKQAFVMFFRFALGDAEAKIFRAKVLILIARYLFGLYFISLCLLYRSVWGFIILVVCLIGYIIWSVFKNYKYVKKRKAIFIFPLLQVTSDFAILAGTSVGMLKRIGRFNYLNYIQHNKLLVIISVIYVFINLLTLKWGIPNQNHPFPYHMDEWHQLQAVANTFRYGTPNMEGSANGTMFHFLLSGIYLIPFIILHIVNPFELQIDNWFMRERIFEILRFQTIIFGILSTFMIYRLVEFIKGPKNTAIILFTFTPIWLMLSGYFKYDIALIFWILFSFFSIFLFSKESNVKNLIISTIPIAFAISTKVSAIPLLFIYVFSFFLFMPFWKKNIKYLFLGIILLIGIILFFGMPDTIFGKGNIWDYLFVNIAPTAAVTQNNQIGMNIFYYLFFIHFPAMFGHGFMFLVFLSLFFWVYMFFVKNFKYIMKNFKVELLVLFSLIVFILSLMVLQIGALGNRSLVLLPFFVLVIITALKYLFINQKWNKIIKIIILCVVVIQIIESISWVIQKINITPQESSSIWVYKNFAKGQKIGLENIPIYQYLPDLIEKDYYFKQYNISKEYLYAYQIIDSKSKSMPAIVIVTNDDIEKRLLKKSPKNDLVIHLKDNGYNKIKAFTSDLFLLNFFISKNDYYLSGIVTTPLEISIYKK